MELATNQPQVFAARLHAKLEAYIIEQVNKVLKYRSGLIFFDALPQKLSKEEYLLILPLVVISTLFDN